MYITALVSREHIDKFLSIWRLQAIAVALIAHALPHLFAGEWITGSVCMYLARYLVTPDPSNLIVSLGLCTSYYM